MEKATVVLLLLLVTGGAGISLRCAAPIPASVNAGSTFRAAVLFPHRGAALCTLAATRPSLRCVQGHSRALSLSMGAGGPAFVSITSTTNALAKKFVRLRDQARFRRTEGSAVVVGSAPIRELCGPGGGARDGLRSLLLLEEDPGDPWHSDFVAALDGPPNVVHVVTPDLFRKIAGIENAEGRQAAAEIALPAFQTVSSIVRGVGSSGVGVVVLDRVQDPGNVGALLRTAAGLGWACVVLEGCCDIFNDKVIRAARGAAWRVPLAQSSLAGLCDAVSLPVSLAASSGEGLAPLATGQCHVWVADMGGCDPAVARKRSGADPIVLLLSNEGAGVSEAVRERVDRGLWSRVGVPLVGDMESLNVAIAGSILMFALRGSTQEN